MTIALTMKLQVAVKHEMSVSAQKMMAEGYLISVEGFVGDIEKVIEERNGKIITCEDIEKVLDIIDAKTLKRLIKQEGQA